MFSLHRQMRRRRINSGDVEPKQDVEGGKEEIITISNRKWVIKNNISTEVPIVSSKDTHTLTAILVVR